MAITAELYRKLGGLQIHARVNGLIRKPMCVHFLSVMRERSALRRYRCAMMVSSGTSSAAMAHPVIYDLKAHVIVCP